MTDAPLYPKARQNGLLSEQVAGEVVVYDGARQEMHSLNRSASIVWRGCDGQRSVPELAAILGDELGMEPNDSLVEYALDELSRANLLETSGDTAQQLTRRAVVRRLSLAGAAALALPVVMSIAAPTPAMAASAVPRPSSI
ncbi:MAG TPA: PqqD family protein [Gemmatimonadaceae bacterium]|jgi:hypothetical protein